MPSPTTVVGRDRLGNRIAERKARHNVGPARYRSKLQVRFDAAVDKVKTLGQQR